MEAKDLMIGDFIRTPRGIGIVNNIYEYSIFTEDGEYEGEEFNIDDVKPITLTPEILEKNGFLENKHVYPYPTYDFRNIEKCLVRIAFPNNPKVTKYKKPFCYVDCEWCFAEHIEINFVHEFQHILKMCGIDKEIVL